jgi:hypothetical protein
MFLRPVLQAAQTKPRKAPEAGWPVPCDLNRGAHAAIFQNGNSPSVKIARLGTRMIRRALVRH